MPTDYSQYMNPNMGNVKDNLINHAAWNTDDVFTDWLNPSQKEERQMGQQLMMDMIEPSAKLQGMMAAGINPLTAGRSIAGMDSQSPQPSSSVNPVGDVASALGAVGAAFGDVSGGAVALSKVGDELDNIRSDTRKNFADIGLTNAETEGVITDNTYKAADWESRLNVQRQQFENMKADYNNIRANHELILQKINESLSQIELNGSQQDYFNAMKAKIDEETRWNKELNDFRISHKLFITDSGIDGYVWNMCENDMPLEQFDKFIERYSQYRHSVSKSVALGQFQADEETAYGRAHGAAKGVYNADPYQQQIREVYDTIDNLSDVIKSLGDLENDFNEAYKNGKISKQDYDIEMRKISAAKKSAEKDLEKLNKEFARHKYEFSHKSLLQDVMSDAVKFGIGAASLGLMRGTPTQVTGFRR